MSWFGDTFGDSLNSLKGQITKITKEVLADDVAAGSDKQESEVPSIKELEALCQSKDLEIASLKSDFDRLQKEYRLELELSKNSNDTNTNCDNNDQMIKKLENELSELKKERDHLNSCLDELQTEHESNLSQVLSISDKYKSELEELKREYNSLKTKLEESTNKKNETIDNNIEITLKSQLEELKTKYEKSCQDYQNELQTSNNYQQEIYKLITELKEINEINKKIEAESMKIVNENDELKNLLNLINKENTEMKVKLKVLLNEKSDLLSKCQSQEIDLSKLTEYETFKSEIEQKMKNLLKILEISSENEIRVSEMITLVENNYYEKFTSVNKNCKEAISDLELELKNLKEEYRSAQEKLKISLEKELEMEKKYQEEISSLKNAQNQEQELINHSQTDDVKRLEQEIAQCMNLLMLKDKEITDYSMSIQKLEQELNYFKDSAVKSGEELESIRNDRMKLESEVENLKKLCDEITNEKTKLGDHKNQLEVEKSELDKMNSELQRKINELEKQVTELTNNTTRYGALEEEIQKMTYLKTELENKVEMSQNENIRLKNECEYLKAQGIVKESSVSELMKANRNFQDKVAELQSQCDALVECEKEVEKWKNASINLQIQLEDLIEKKEEIENECLKLKSETEGLKIKDMEIEKLKITNSNLMKSFNELHDKMEEKAQEEQSILIKEKELQDKYNDQSEMITQLQDENSELKCRVQKFQQELKLQIELRNSGLVPKEEVQQHRRSKSAADCQTPIMVDNHQSESQSSDESSVLKQALQQEQAKYQLLKHQFMELSNNEASFRNKFERLKQHLIEVEDHYTEESVENEKIINDLKMKLVAAEEQLQNSSTLYTSLKVRDNQHLESLQSQIRMVTAQRDDLQVKLSGVEDEIQKHKASLMSLQIVLEQFQQDKEKEIEQVSMRYEQQLQLSDARFSGLESEMDGLRKQLEEAKNGLKAASRLGEQLEKKTRLVTELEEKVTHLNRRITELEESLSTANQANNGKTDKSLIKNLVVGYVLSPNAERKSQVLRIMASVLDFDQEERDKMGVDSNKSGWLSNILHPKGEGSSSSQSLSEAFIKFLENESRPQPQLKLLPEQPTAPRTSRTSPKPSGRLTELMLPTFNSSQENDSSIILKNVLTDSLYRPN